MKALTHVNLTRFEREVYEFIKKRGEIKTSDIPPKMGGAIPNLIRKGLIEIYKRETSLWRSKKSKFVRVKEEAVAISSS